MSDYQICAVIDGDDVDLRANREKFRILEQTVRDKMKELGLDKPRCGVVSCCTEVPKPLRHYCPECKQETLVMLIYENADVQMLLTNEFGNIVENRDNVGIEPDENTTVRCVCYNCRHVFCLDVVPETVEQFKKMCGKEKHHE